MHNPCLKGKCHISGQHLLTSCKWPCSQQKERTMCRHCKCPQHQQRQRCGCSTTQQPKQQSGQQNKPIRPTLPLGEMLVPRLDTPIITAQCSMPYPILQEKRPRDRQTDKQAADILRYLGATREQRMQYPRSRRQHLLHQTVQHRSCTATCHGLATPHVPLEPKCHATPPRVSTLCHNHTPSTARTAARADWVQLHTAACGALENAVSCTDALHMYKSNSTSLKRNQCGPLQG